MIYFVVAFAFVAGFLFIFGMNLLISDLAAQRRQHLQEQLQLEHRLRAQQRARGALAKKDDAGKTGYLSQIVAEGKVEPAAGESFWSRYRRMVDQSGLNVNATQLIVLSLVLGLLPALVVAAFFPHSWLIAIVLAFLGGSLPTAFVSMKCRQRKEKLLSQLPDAFELMSRVLRSGQTISQALQVVADEASDPIADELGYCYEQQNLGLSSEAALRDLARRTDLLEMRIFVVAVSVNRETGGNLSRLLDKLSRVIRERYRIRGQIKALTAEGKMQAVILLGLPWILTGVLVVTSRDYISQLFELPAAMGVMLISQIIGALWMRAIINFDF